MSPQTARRTPEVTGLPPAPRTDFGPRADGRYAYRGSGLPGRLVDRNHGAVERVPPPRTPETPTQRVNGLVWGGAWEAARFLPSSLAFGIARGGGLSARGLRALRGRASAPMIRRNLARVVSPAGLDDAVARAYDSYSRYYMEAFRAADLDPDVLHERTTTAGFEHLDGVLEEGRGAIILLAHHGSWDIAARWAESHGYHLACVAEVLRPRRVFAKFVEMREALGLEIVPLRRGENLDGRLQEVLAANHLVGLLTDRDLSGRAPLVNFFGEPARIPVGPSRLSAATQTKIVPITMLHRPGMRYHLQILEPFDTVGLDPVEGVQRTARALEDLIRLDPAQWHAFQPIFEVDRDGAGRG